MEEFNIKSAAGKYYDKIVFLKNLLELEQDDYSIIEQREDTICLNKNDSNIWEVYFFKNGTKENLVSYLTFESAAHDLIKRLIIEEEYQKICLKYFDNYLDLACCRNKKWFSYVSNLMEDEIYFTEIENTLNRTPLEKAKLDLYRIKLQQYRINQILFNKKYKANKKSTCDIIDSKSYNSGEKCKCWSINREYNQEDYRKVLFLQSLLSSQKTKFSVFGYKEQSVCLARNFEDKWLVYKVENGKRINIFESNDFEQIAYEMINRVVIDNDNINTISYYFSKYLPLSDGEDLTYLKDIEAIIANESMNCINYESKNRTLLENFKIGLYHAHLEGLLIKKDILDKNNAAKLNRVFQKEE